jgi:tripartite-type tricarboxylate transporter receptor subunit TctC
MHIKHLIGAVAALSMGVVAGTGMAAGFPDKDLQGFIMWGAGGATDVVARAVTPLAEAALGKSIVLTNKSGGTGAIATLYVHSRPSDGYTLLYGAENPQLYKVLDLAKVDYDNFYPVNVLAHGVGVVVVREDAPWKTFKDLMDDILKNPGKIKMGTTGVGGLPHTIGSMLQTEIKYDVIAVPFDGEGPGTTALLGGHVDYMSVGISAAAENIKAGRLRALTVVDTKPVASLPGVPPITDFYPGFSKYLPWGPFYGVFVNRDTPDEAKKVLTAAFKKAADDPKFQQLMENRGNVMMNISGAEADTFLTKWRSVTSWVLQDAGAAKISPEKFGIPKP